MDRVAESNRDQYQREDRKINIRVRRGARQPRNGLQNEVRNNRQSRAAGYPFHLLPQFGRLDFAVGLKQNDGAQHEDQAEMKIPKVIENVTQHDRRRSKPHDAIDERGLRDEEQSAWNINEIQQAAPPGDPLVAQGELQTKVQEQRR